MGSHRLARGASPDTSSASSQPKHRCQRSPGAPRKRPPLTSSTWPLTRRPSFDAKKATLRAPLDIEYTILKA